jgi:hypothetical protein
MTATLIRDAARQHFSTKASTAALWVVTGGAIAMVAATAYAFTVAAVNLVGAVFMSAESIENGASYPAAAYDGISSGTWTDSALSITAMYDGNGVPSAEARGWAHEQQSIVLPYFASQTINALLLLALSVVVLLLCIRLLRGRPFARQMTWSLATLAVVVAVGTISSQLLRHLPFNDSTYSLRADLALAIRESQINGQYAAAKMVDGSGYAPGVLGWSIDLTFVAVAVLIALIAAAFAIGARLQHDSDGLV